MKKYTLADLLPQTAMMEIIHPIDGPTGTFLELVGRDSPNFRKVIKTMAQREIDQKNNDKEVKANSIDDLEAQGAEMISSCIVGWDKEVFGEYSPAKAKEYILNPGLTWLREQVEAFVTDRANFFRKDTAKAK